jgi:hypothetical protein
MRSIQDDSHNSPSDTNPQTSRDRQPANSEAVFLGWQETAKGTVALYNVIKKDHPLCNSTVTEDTLRKHNLNAPQIRRDT